MFSRNSPEFKRWKPCARLRIRKPEETARVREAEIRQAVEGVTVESVAQRNLTRGLEGAFPGLAKTHRRGSTSGLGSRSRRARARRTGTPAQNRYLRYGPRPVGSGLRESEADPGTGDCRPARGVGERIGAHRGRAQGAGAASRYAAHVLFRTLTRSPWSRQRTAPARDSSRRAL